MQYLIPMTKRSHHIWQVEFLLESMKMLGIMDKAVVAIADNGLDVYGKLKNLNQVQKFITRDQKVNVVASLHLAREHEYIVPPYTILHPDMILLKDIRSNFDVCLDSYGSGIDKVFIDELNKEIPTDVVLPTSGIITINNEPNTFINNLIYFVRYFSNISPNANAERSAFALAIWNSFGNLSVGITKMSSSIPDENPSDAIHYFQGYPPRFDKKLFGDDVYIGNLEKSIFDIPPVGNANRFKDVVSSWLKHTS